MTSSTSLLSRLRIGRILVCIALLLLVWRLLPTSAQEWSGDLWHDIRTWTQEKYADIAKASEAFATLSDGEKGLPESSVFKRDQNDQRRRMDEQLKTIRSILLPPSSISLIPEIDRLDREIKKLEDGNMADKTTRIVSLRTARRKAFEKLQLELSHIGLKTDSAKNAATAILTAEARTLVENAMVAKSAECVVETIRANMDPVSMNHDLATRYYGMYLAMLEVQVVCFDNYLSQSESQWLPRLDRAETESEMRKNEQKAKAESTELSDEDRKQIETLIHTEEQFLARIANERKRQQKRADAIREKREKIQGKIGIARLARDQAKALSDWVHLISDMDANYAAVTEPIPTLDLFSDSQLFAELDAREAQLAGGKGAAAP